MSNHQIFHEINKDWRKVHNMNVNVLQSFVVVVVVVVNYVMTSQVYVLTLKSHVRDLNRNIKLMNFDKTATRLTEELTLKHRCIS